LVEIHGSLRIEVHADVDAGRVPCIAGAVKGVADKHGMGFRVSDDLARLLREAEESWSTRGLAGAVSRNRTLLL